MGVPSLRRECKQCLRSRQKQSKMSTVPQTMQPIVRGVNMVSEVVDVCRTHVSVFDLRVARSWVNYAYVGLEESRVTILV